MELPLRMLFKNSASRFGILLLADVPWRFMYQVWRTAPRGLKMYGASIVQFSFAVCVRLQSSDATRIEVVETETGCVPGVSATVIWNREQDKFASSGRGISVAEFDAIYSTLEDASSVSELSLDSLGITEGKFRSHINGIKDQVVPEFFRGIPDAPCINLTELESMKWTNVSKAIQDEIEGRGLASISSVKVAISINGSKPISAVASGEYPFLLPWKIVQGERSLITYDVRIPKALLKLVSTSGPGRKALDGSLFWSETFWNYDPFWRQHVGPELERLLCEKACRSWPGWTEIATLAHLENAAAGEFLSFGRSFRFDARVFNGQRALSVTWYNPSLRGLAPEYDWRDFSRGISRLKSLLVSRPWVERMCVLRQATIRATFVGDGALKCGDEPLVSMAWKSIMEKGQPEYMLRLQNTRGWSLEVWISKDDARSLVTCVADTAGQPARKTPEASGVIDFAFDDASFSIFDGQRELTCAVVERSGGASMAHVR